MDEDFSIQFCEVTGKRCYSQRDAGKLVNSSKCRFRGKKVPKRIYFCPSCGTYHVTHHKFVISAKKTEDQIKNKEKHLDWLRKVKGKRGHKDIERKRKEKKVDEK